VFLCRLLSSLKKQPFAHVIQSSQLVLMSKKSELMLMRCARAYSSSCSQVILVYFYPFHHNSLFCSQKLPKITKNQYF